MTSIGRMLVIWWLVLSTPAQALAVVGLLHCAAPSAAGHESGHAAAHEHAIVGGSMVDAYAQAHGRLAGAAPDQAATQTSLLDSIDGDRTCSVCAACCLGAVLPAEAIEITTPDPDTKLVAAAPMPSEGIAPRRVERPPRTPGC